MPRKSLQGGYCHYPNARCALESKDCFNDNDFSSSRQMQGTPGAHGGNCLLQDSIKDFGLGKCGNGLCSPNAKSCGGDPSAYTSDTSINPTCTIHSTKFGKCGDRCSWSAIDCKNNENWTFPADGCTCDKVRIGGCVKDGLTYCGVSELSCDSDSVWFDPIFITAETNYECYLCRQPAKPTTDDLIEEVKGDDDISGGTRQNPSKGKTSTGAIVGATMGSLAGVAALIVAFVLVKRKHSNKKSNSVKEIQPPVTVPSFNDECDVSVL